MDYPAGVASIFSSEARKVAPVYEGQPCCYCQDRAGDLEFFTYDSRDGYLWIHKHCKKKLRRDIEKIELEQAEQAGRNPLYR